MKAIRSIDLRRDCVEIAQVEMRCDSDVRFRFHPIEELSTLHGTKKESDDQFID